MNMAAVWSSISLFMLAFRRVKIAANFVSPYSKIVERIQCRTYDPVIIERTMILVLVPSTSLYRPFQERCTLTNKAVGTL